MSSQLYAVPATSSPPGFSVRVGATAPLEPVELYRVTFEGFDRRAVAVPFEGTRSAVVAWTGELVQGGARDVRYTCPDGLEVRCYLRRGADVRPGWIYGETGYGTAPLVLAVAILAVFAVLAVVAIGRAVDNVGMHYVTFTRDGQTVTCERITDVAGRTFYDSCDVAP